MKPSRLIPVIWILAVAVCLALTAANLYYGDLNQDEGWYLYAAGLVAKGQLPYIDFGFSQGPVMPMVYSLVSPVVDAAGVAGGRLVTAFLGICAACLAAVLAARVTSGKQRPVAALVAFILIAVNVYQSYFFTVVKTYSLSALLLAMAFLALSFVGQRRGFVPALAAGVLLALATGTRLSAGVAVPVVFLFLAYRVRKGPRGIALSACVGLVLGASAAACSIFLPYFIAARESSLFWLLEYHSHRQAGPLAALMVYKAGFISRVVGAYFVACGILAAVVVQKLLVRGSPPAVANTDAAGETWLPAALWVTVAAVTAVHLCAPFPYDDYQAMVFPLLGVALASSAVRLVDGERGRSWLLVLVFLLCTASSFSSARNQEWVIRGRDRIWWRMRDGAALRKLWQAGAIVRTSAGAGREILTQDTYLAVEAGLSVPPGLEMGPFSYYPGWSDERAAACHVLNEKTLRRLLETSDATVAAFSGYGLAIGSPGVVQLPDQDVDELWKLVLARYSVVDKVEHFGQGLTTLKVLVLREETDTR